ncbi:MAG: hypothetical protein QOD72_846 [Acidimicrobiaceae bacterium]|nr:hypothetical protein [Acidimicrobiaceae bacterium]
MSDPFDVLRVTDQSTAPDAGFARRLKARVAAALTEPLETTQLEVVGLPERRTTMATTSAAPVTKAATITPYLCVADAKAALTWYADALGANEEVRYVGDDGRIGHAEITIEGARVMLSDEYAEAGVAPPLAGRGHDVTLHLNVADVDATFARAVAKGATPEREPADQAYGERSSTITDPFGHRWMIQTTIATPADAAIEGFTVTTRQAPVELGYFTLGFADTHKARRFFGALFGWQSEQGHAGADYAHIANTHVPLGFTPDGVDSPPTLYFRVDDVDRYAGRVVELGGRVVARATYESGLNAICRDDQGREFQLWQAAPGY